MYPINEQLSRSLLGVIEGVTEAAGYNVTLAAIRPTRPPTEARKLLAVLYEGDDVPVEGPIGFQTWLRPYGVLVFAMGSEGDVEPYDTLLNVAAADVQKAIMADVSQGGIARNTFMRSPVKLEDDGEPPAILIAFDCEYRYVYLDPYRQG